jgi:hypothetical protein
MGLKLIDPPEAVTSDKRFGFSSLVPAFSVRDISRLADVTWREADEELPPDSAVPGIGHSDRGGKAVGPRDRLTHQRDVASVDEHGDLEGRPAVLADELASVPSNEVPDREGARRIDLKNFVRGVKSRAPIDGDGTRFLHGQSVLPDVLPVDIIQRHIPLCVYAVGRRGPQDDITQSPVDDLEDRFLTLALTAVSQLGPRYISGTTSIESRAGDHDGGMHDDRPGHRAGGRGLRAGHADDHGQNKHT